MIEKKENNRRAEWLRAFERLIDVQYRLRQDCPWDRKQTFESLRPNTMLRVYQPLEGAKPLGAPVVFFLFYHNGKGTKFSFLGKKNRPIPAFIGKLMQIMASKAGDLGKKCYLCSL